MPSRRLPRRILLVERPPRPGEPKGFNLMMEQQDGRTLTKQLNEQQGELLIAAWIRAAADVTGGFIG